MTRRIAFAIALVAALAMATGAYADYTGGGDTQAPRGQDSQSPRASDHSGTDIQAPRG
jgi:hypothetical protein